MKLRHCLTVLAAVLVLAEANSIAADPRKLAEDKLDEIRGEDHKKKVRIIWPDKVPEMPAEAEVYLIVGYINYRCTRLHWVGGKPKAAAFEANRSWFYNPKGESFKSETFEVDAASFQDAWKSAALISQAKAELIDPPENKFGGSRSMMSSSHASTYWVRLKSDGAVQYINAVRGSSSSDGIRDFNEIQNTAIYGLLKPLIDEKNGKPALLNDWSEFMKQQVADNFPAEGEKELKQLSRLPLETSLRMLGQNGYAPAMELIEKLEWRLASMESDYWAKCVREECEQALVKIRFTNAWDPAEAHKWIVANARERHAQNDVAKWLRRKFHAQDAEGYLARLLADIREHTNDDALLMETLSELRELYLDRAKPAFETLLKHPDPEVSADAALSLLKTDKNHADAIAVLNKLATDTSLPIAPGAHWFHDFGRARAVDFYLHQAGEAKWSQERILAQIFSDNEDGRIVYRLIEDLKRGNFKDNGIYVRAWQKVLAGKVNRGALLAVEQLIELGAVESIPQIEKLLAELESGRNADLNWKRDDKAKYPWTDKYELDGVQKKLYALKTKRKE